jgi:hypothetical protein
MKLSLEAPVWPELANSWRAPLEPWAGGGDLREGALGSRVKEVEERARDTPRLELERWWLLPWRSDRLVGWPVGVGEKR